ncbi:MAG: DUF2344 domain-containing protein [Elusimicrobiota bacterium]
MIRYRFVFSRDKRAKDIGFLRQVEQFRNMFRNAFSDNELQKNKISFGPAIPCGYESLSEYVDIYLSRRIQDEEIKFIINKNICEGYSLLRFKTIPLYFPSVESCVDIAEYEILTDDESPLIFAKEDDSINCSEKCFKVVSVSDVKKNGERIIIYMKKLEKPEAFLTRLDKSINVKGIIRKNLYWLDSKKTLRII